MQRENDVVDDPRLAEVKASPVVQKFCQHLRMQGIQYEVIIIGSDITRILNEGKLDGKHYTLRSDRVKSD